MTREEHLAWCKQRALEYVDRGQPLEGITSMMSDMRKHPECKSDALDSLTMGLLMIGQLRTQEQARKHINGSRSTILTVHFRRVSGREAQPDNMLATACW